MNKISTILGLNEIYQKYDAFILDQWGVMHDGHNGFENAIHCIKRLFDKNKLLFIISNSSKRKKATISRLPGLGFDPKYFKEVLTSGEMIWQSLIKKNYDETKNLGKNCFHISNEKKEDGKSFLEGLDKFNFVNNISEADFILGCTPFFKHKVIDYVPLLELAKKNDLPFICANPDYETVESKSLKLTFCIGTIAELYKNIGGKTFILGKPKNEIYHETIQKFSNLKKSRILAIGDSLHHDIKGAMNFGVDSLLITSTGIHKALFDKKNPNWHNNYKPLPNLQVEPTYISSEFVF